MAVKQQNILINKATIQHIMMGRGRYGLQKNKKKGNWKEHAITVI